MGTRRYLAAVHGLAIAGLLVQFACGGGAKPEVEQTVPPATPVSVILDAPSEVTVGGTIPLTVQVLGTTNTAVTWTVDNIPNGNADVGIITSSGDTFTYTAPSTVGSHMLVVSSVSDPTKSDSAQVSVLASATISSVAVEPTSWTLNVSAQKQFDATVSGTGTYNSAVTWSAQRGTVTTGGLYTAPVTGGTDLVRATSQADRTKYAEATVTVVDSTLPPQLGQGWVGSRSLIDYPKTGPVTTGGQIVNIDDGAGEKTLEGRFLDALALLASNDCVLIRNDSGAPVMMTSHLLRKTAWPSKKRIFAYGSQRIKLDFSMVPSSSRDNQQSIFFDGAANEHWKGFAITGTASPNGNIDVENSNNMTFEDIWIHHNLDGSGLTTGSSNRVLMQDCLYWHNGTPGYQPATNSGDGFSVAFGTGCAIVRCLAINAPDDGFDLYFGDHVKIIDCVAIRSGIYFDGSDAGDGSGFKIGGDAAQGDRCKGGTTMSGSVALLNKVGISHWQAHGAPRTVSHCTSYRNSYNFGIRAIPGDVIDSNLANTATHADQIEVGTNNHWTSGPDPLFVDPTKGNLSLDGHSPCIGAGSGGSTQGASLIALQLLLDNWSLK